MREKSVNSKVLASVISLFLIVLIVLSGPANALILGLSVSDNSPNRGDIVNVDLNVDLDQEDIVKLKKFTLLLQGPTNINCGFSLEGDLKSSCKGITISKSNGDFGYGYGYGYGENHLRYVVSINTSILRNGEYNLYVLAKAGKDIKSEVQKITVGLDANNIESCSIRADGGILTINETSYTDNSLSLYVPKFNAQSGQGLILSEPGKNRFSDKFSVVQAKVLENGLLEFKTSGKLNGLLKGNYNATIQYDKNMSEVNIYSDKFQITGMEVSFSKC